MKLIKTMLGLLLMFTLLAVLSGCGGGGSSNGSNGGSATYKYFTYIVAYNNIFMYTMDYATGTLSTSAVEYPVPGGDLRAMVQHPSKPYLYITTVSSEDKTVRVLSITPTTGELTEIQTINTSGYEEIEITPDGKYLYTSGQGLITGYQVFEDGKLTQVEENYYYPNHIKVAPDGNVLYATYDYQVDSSYARYLAAYNINLDGTLTRRTKIDYTDVLSNIAVFGQFVYSTTQDEMYQFNGGATLNQNGTINTGYGAMVATRGYLYAIRAGSIYGFSIDASTGSLTETGAAYPYPATNAYIRKLSVDPDGKYLYAVDEDNKALWGYSIATSGELTKLNWNVTVPNTPFSALIAKVRQ